MRKSDTLEWIAQQWFAAFNTKNIDNLLSLYDANARHFSPKLLLRQPETKGWIEGKAAMRIWWQDAFDRLPNLHYEVTTLTANSERVFMEYIRQVAGEEDIRVAEVLVVQNGLIVESRVYHG